MKYLRLYADQHGESHVEEMLAEFSMAVYAPPAPAFGVSDPTDAKRFIMVHFPAGWDSEPHPAPRRQLFVVLSGQFQGQASDGTVLDLQPGDVVLMEDTTGKGHSARTIGGSEVHALMVHLE
jgi:mannose-6-phosphate isomerase-like protein (cupin superfamily)